MELIKVIYLSLGVFTIIVLIILAISFFSYKVKNKLGIENEKEDVKPEMKPEVKTKNGKPVERKKKSKKIAIKRKKKVATVKKTEKKKEIRAEKQVGRKNIITNESKPRIEIVNKITPKKESNTKKIEHSEKDSQDDFLSHYSDENDDDFKAITD